MMKKDGVERKVRRIYKSLDAIERGLYAEFSIDYICSQIDWLWKFRYITEEEMESLVNRAIEIMNVKY